MCLSELCVLNEQSLALQLHSSSPCSRCPSERLCCGLAVSHLAFSFLISSFLMTCPLQHTCTRASCISFFVIPSQYMCTTCLSASFLSFLPPSFFISVHSLASLTCVCSSSALLHPGSTLPALLTVQRAVSEHQGSLGHGPLNRADLSAAAQTVRKIHVCTHQHADTEKTNYSNMCQF